MKNKFLDTIALVVSALSSPFLVICGFALWVIAHYSNSTYQFILFGGLFFVFITVLPLVWIQAGVRMGKFTDIHVMVKEQRFEPFVVATIGAIVLSVVYQAISAPHELVVLAANLAVNGIVFAFLSKMWKVSVHAASYAASVLIVSLLIEHQLYWLILFLPIIVWARIRRRKHNVEQSLAAAVIVSIVTLLVFYLLGVHPSL